MSAERARRALKTVLAAAVLAAALSPVGCALSPAEDGGKAFIRNGAATAASAPPASSAASDRTTGAGTSAFVRPAETSAGTPSPTTPSPFCR